MLSCFKMDDSRGETRGKTSGETSAEPVPLNCGGVGPCLVRPEAKQKGFLCSGAVLEVWMIQAMTAKHSTLARHSSTQLSTVPLPGIRAPLMTSTLVWP